MSLRLSNQKKMRWARHVARMGMMTNVYNILVGKSERKRPIGRTLIDGRIIFNNILGK
jgi:hypothetical protein